MYRILIHQSLFLFSPSALLLPNILPPLWPNNAFGTFNSRTSRISWSFSTRKTVLCAALIRSVPPLLYYRIALQTSTGNDVIKHPLNQLTSCACGSVTRRSRFDDHVFSLNHKLFLKPFRSTLASQATSQRCLVLRRLLHHRVHQRVMPRCPPF